MKNLFPWAFPLTEKEIKNIWKDGILSVDTNVLLDLYRYNENTQNALLDSLFSFQGRAWISFQVAEEFFRNRRTTIISSEIELQNTLKMVSDLKESIGKPLLSIKNIRNIPNSLIKKYEDKILENISKLENEINEIIQKYPHSIYNDKILEKLNSLFEGKTGSQYDNDRLDEVTNEAKHRIENKIPPGFNDAKKSGEKPYGDYFVWQQIIDYVKEQNKPVIFVTGDKKSDWWEKVNNRIAGPQLELEREFYKETNQRIIIYTTDRFLEFSAENSGKSVNKAAVEEIISLGKQRYSPLTQIIQHSSLVNENGLVSGTIQVVLREPTFMFTCSGGFDPPLDRVPKLKVSLTSCPPNAPTHKFLYIGTGTTFDFHIHLKSNEYGVTLPTGEYSFEYSEI